MKANLRGDFDMEEAGAAIEARLGLDFPPSRRRDLQRSLVELAQQHAPGGDVAAWAERLVRGELAPRETAALVAQLTVGETYFFREKALFEALEFDLLPARLAERRRGNRRLRVWCAGCCTGEEPYSIAMLLERMLPDIGSWDIRILATDLNPGFLQHAAAGIYKNWSFREDVSGLKERFFQRLESGHYQVLPRLRARVTFVPMNLVADIYPATIDAAERMDLILCRNVLMYFSERWRRHVVERLYENLLPGGWLAVGSAETSQELFHRFRPVSLRQIVIYQKASPEPEARSRARAEPPTEDRLRGATAAGPRAPRESLSPHVRPGEAGHAGPPGATSSRAASRLVRNDRPRARPEVPTSSRHEADEVEQFVRRARLAADRGGLPDALECCDRALTIEPLNPLGHYLRATILDELGRTAEAVVALQRVLYLDPSFVLAHFALGHLTLRQKHTKQADQHFANVVELLRGRPDDEVLPESGGLTAGHLVEVVRQLRSGGAVT